jgi:glycosyltransferase involved in cell wall biosynthesis
MAEDLGTPLVSVNIPTYNRGRYIKSAIDSVLAQSLTDWELIIVDDASTDGTDGIVRPYLIDPRIKYLANEQNQNISRSRNRALTESRGKYIAILDSDDLWTDPDKLAKQVAFLELHPDHAAVGTNADLIDPAGRTLGRTENPESDKAIRRLMLRQNPIIHSSVLYRKEAALTAGLYDPELNAIEDYDLWLRLGREAKLANLPDRLIGYRIHPGNTSVIDRLRLLRENINLIRRDRANYPNYLLALARRRIRLAAFRLLSLFRNRD